MPQPFDDTSPGLVVNPAEYNEYVILQQQIHPVLLSWTQLLWQMSRQALISFFAEPWSCMTVL